MTNLRTVQTEVLGSEYGVCAMCPKRIDARVGTVVDEDGAEQRVPQIRCPFRTKGKEWVPPIVCQLMSDPRECLYWGKAVMEASTANALMEHYWNECGPTQSSIPYQSIVRIRRS